MIKFMISVNEKSFDHQLILLRWMMFANRREDEQDKVINLQWTLIKFITLNSGKD